MDIRPIPFCRLVEVVDEGIQRTLEAIAGWDGDVMLGSHDGDFPPVETLLDAGRRVARGRVSEYVSAAYADLSEHGDLRPGGRHPVLQPAPAARCGSSLDEFNPDAVPVAGPDAPNPPAGGGTGGGRCGWFG